MSFSITGDILTGSFLRPDIVTFCYRKDENLVFNNKKSVAFGADISKLNVAGYIPAVSTFTGLGRSLLGLVHTISHLVIALFTQKKHHLLEVDLGARNFGRGLVEMVPILGNLAMLANDVRRYLKYEDKAEQEANTWPLEIGGTVGMYFCGQLVCTQPRRDVRGCGQSLGKIEQAMYGHINGRIPGHPYKLPEFRVFYDQKNIFSVKNMFN